MKLKEVLKFRRRHRDGATLEHLRQDIDVDVHVLESELLLEKLKTDASRGLSTAKARNLQREHGMNTLTPPKETPEIFKLLRCLCGGFSLLIWVGALLCFGSYFLEKHTYGIASDDHLWLGMVLILLILVTGMFSYYQNSKSSKIMESFKGMLPEKTKVLRDEYIKELYVSELVVGDIVFLETGDRVPADIRLLECQGTAKGVVVACGDLTVMGRVAKLTSRLIPRPTPLSREIHRFMILISCWAVFLGVFFFGMSVALGYGWIDSVIFLIGIIVANVPEGLLATVTVSLTLTAKQMANKNCLIKNLEAIETLGCTAVICSDKTGTLTQNKMTVRHAWYNGQLREIMASDTWSKYANSRGFLNLARVASLCNRAEWAPLPDGLPVPPLNKRKVLGDPLESALLKCMEVLVRGGAHTFRKAYTKVFEIPFNSTDKFQADVHLGKEMHLISLKGAPESVLERCSTVAQDGGTRELDEETKMAYTEACHVLANNGERVLGFADRVLSFSTFPKGYEFKADPPNFPLNNLRLVGLISMMDPPRPTVPDAVYKCRCAGIKVIMVTGDHPDTARAIAKYVGIVTEDHQNEATRHSIVVTGPELRDLQPGQLDSLIRHYPEIVFARTSPVQKLQIVESCHRLHLITAVTGDGVNDSPALKKADIGVAMGVAGSDVSRQVADLILLDDNFATIVTGIEEGRRVFDNLKSSIAYTLASNVPEVTPFLAFIALGIPLPVGIICILCIDVGTDMWPAISLAYEKSEGDIMLRKPRVPHTDHLVNRKLIFMAYGQIGIIEAAAGFFTYFVIMAESGFFPGKLLGLRPYWDSSAVNDLEDSYGQQWTYKQRKILEHTCHTAFFVSIVIVQCADAIICKTSRTSIFRQGMNNWILNFGLIFEIVMASVVCYAPYMDVILKTYPLHGEWWIPGIPFACWILIYDELRKWWIRKHPGGWWDRETAY